MTRQEIENAYVIENGVIRNPGRFEGEPVYAPHFVDFVFDGSAHDLLFADDATVSIVDIDAEDRLAFPELPADARYIAMEQADTGFWHVEPITEAEYAQLEADAEASFDDDDCDDESADDEAE